ncbi:FKBP-type peptidyl-prolyl cis-trans isomerase [Alteromonadaceae bacterium BrNp21-10]|nr:FKBP-type peptidyl-prolyl cis-trans isomerase [Alteromonadaceae bacterium BrNp21-10]
MSDKYATVEQQASYGIGLQMGEQLAGNPFDGLDISAVQAGIATAFNKQPSEVSNDQLRVAFDQIHQQMQAAKEESSKAVIAEGAAFLAENAKRDEVTVTESGLQYEVITAGTGEIPTAASTVRTHYHGSLIDGTVFDSSYDRGQPAEFPVGGVIKGWTEALQLMTTGSKWKLFIPQELAYGENGAGAAIAPYATLVFDIELLDIL